jgi:hypothetical protein
LAEEDVVDTLIAYDFPADDRLTVDEVLEKLATAGCDLPHGALREAAVHWNEFGPRLIGLLRAYAEGADRSARTEEILFFGIYLMAQVRDTSAFAPLCAIAAADAREPIGRLIGDGVTEGLSKILVSVYDGDSATLRALIENQLSDEFARDAAFETLSYLAVSGQIDRDETAAYLRRLFATLQPRAESYVWVSWQSAISSLALDDLVPSVEEAFRRGFIGDWIMGLEHFHEDLAAAKAADVPMAEFATELAKYDDIVALLSEWDSFQPKSHREYAAPVPIYFAEPIRNPLRHVGRNDPCPCGSAKKFKKCCLGSAA